MNAGTPYALSSPPLFSPPCVDFRGLHTFTATPCVKVEAKVKAGVAIKGLHMVPYRTLGW